MTKLISVEALEQFIEEAEITFSKFEQAQEILMEMPALTSEAFGFQAKYDAKAIISGGLNKVIYRVNTNFFIGKVDTSAMIPYASEIFYSELHNRFDLEKGQMINELMLNNVDLAAVLSRALASDTLNDTEFKGVMRIASSYNSANINKNFVTNLIFVAAKLNNQDIEIKKLQDSITYLPKGDALEFDLGLSLSIAKNGNLTLKLSKPLVAQFNELLKQSFGNAA